MHPHPCFRLARLFLLALALMVVWNCNISTPVEAFFLKVEVNDSLAIERGLYDTLEVDLLDTSGVVVEKGLFSGVYHLADSNTLAKLPLISPPPTPFAVRITAHSLSSDAVLILISRVLNGIPQPFSVTLVSPIDSSQVDPAHSIPTQLSITSPSSVNVHAGDTLPLVAIPDKGGASQALQWNSSNPEIAKIVLGNKLVALMPGAFTLKATLTEFPAVFDTLALTVLPKSTLSDPESTSLRMPIPMILPPNGGLGEILWVVFPESAARDMTWSSSDTNIAKVTSDNHVRSGILGSAIIKGFSKVKPTVKVQFEVQVVKAVKVDSITLSPKKLRLFTGGSDGQLSLTTFGNDTGAQFIWSSSDANIASVSGKGTVTGRKSGDAVISASVAGYSNINAACSVTVVTDPPRVSLSPDQNVAFGGEGIFKLSVTQEFGTVIEIKADMDGDGTYEQSQLGLDTAVFRATYLQVKVFDLAFQVKDSEGNVVNLTRKVTVLPPGIPVVTITDPARDITVNMPAYTVKFTVKDPTKPIDETKDSSVTLNEGANSITVARTNAGGTGTASVIITLDRTAPGIPVFASQAAYTTDNTPTWTWGAVSGAAKYQIRLDDSIPSVNPMFRAPFTLPGLPLEAGHRS